MGCSGKESVSPSPHGGPPQDMRGGWGVIALDHCRFPGCSWSWAGGPAPPALPLGFQGLPVRVTVRCRRQDVTSNLKRSCCRGGGRPGCWRGFQGTQCKHDGCSSHSRLLPQPLPRAEHLLCPQGDWEWPAGWGHDPSQGCVGSMTGENVLMPPGLLLEWWQRVSPSLLSTQPLGCTGRWIWQLWDDVWGPCSPLSSWRRGR